MFGISKNSVIIAVLLVIFSESPCCSEILSKMSLLDGGVTETVINWQTSYPGESLICVGSRPARYPVDDRDDIAGEFKFRIFKASGNTVEKIYELVVGEELLYAYPLGTDGTGRLLVGFNGRKADRVMIFGYIGNKVTLLLQTGGTAYREFAYDDKGNELIIVSNEDTKDERHPFDGDTYIYKWNGKQYEKFGPFPASTRFDKIRHIISGKKIPKKWRYKIIIPRPTSSPCQP